MSAAAAAAAVAARRQAGTGFADRFVQPEPEPEPGAGAEPEPEGDAEPESTASTRERQIITPEALVALRQIIREYDEFQKTTMESAVKENEGLAVRCHNSLRSGCCLSALHQVALVARTAVGS